MKKFLTLLALCFVFSTAQAGFNQVSYAVIESFTYGTAMSSTVQISYSVEPAPGAQQLYIKTDVAQANENSSQLVKLYLDAALTQPFFGQVVDVKAFAGTGTQTLTLYAKYYSATKEYLSEAGVSTFTIPIYMMDNNVETSSNVNFTITNNAICSFSQSNYAIDKVGQRNAVNEDTVSISYTCSNGLSAQLSTTSTSYQSQTDSSITVSLFGEANATQNLGSVPLALVADGNQQNKTLHLKYYQEGQAIITKTGTFQMSVPIMINY